MPPVELADFTSYDLGRLHAFLVDEQERRGRDVYGVHLYWAGAQQFLPWDQRARKCWDDDAFAARYQWLRDRLIPEGAKHDYPLAAIVEALGRVVAERMALDPEEPF